jgi:hypothetical protein
MCLVPLRLRIYHKQIAIVLKLCIVHFMKLKNYI